LLAEVCGIRNQIEEGLSMVTEALALADRNEERWWEAELHRLKGELSRQSSREADAEQCFWKAIEIARDQRAKSLELRAVMSLSRLWHSQGKTAQARQILSELHDWFIEGFDTKDLQEAKALLQELGSKREAQHMPAFPTTS
jgi:predicted ATPase